MIILAMVTMGVGLVLIRSGFAPDPDPRQVIASYLGRTPDGGGRSIGTAGSPR